MPDTGERIVTPMDNKMQYIFHRFLQKEIRDQVNTNTEMNEKIMDFSKKSAKLAEDILSLGESSKWNKLKLENKSEEWADAVEQEIGIKLGEHMRSEMRKWATVQQQGVPVRIINYNGDTVSLADKNSPYSIAGLKKLMIEPIKDIEIAFGEAVEKSKKGLQIKGINEESVKRKIASKLKAFDKRLQEKDLQEAEKRQKELSNLHIKAKANPGKAFNYDSPHITMSFRYNSKKKKFERWQEPFDLEHSYLEDGTPPKEAAKYRREYEEGLKRGESIEEYNIGDIKSQYKKELKKLEAAFKARFGKGPDFEERVSQKFDSALWWHHRLPMMKYLRKIGSKKYPCLLYTSPSPRD